MLTKNTNSIAISHCRLTPTLNSCCKVESQCFNSVTKRVTEQMILKYGFLLKINNNLLPSFNRNIILQPSFYTAIIHSEINLPFL